MAFLDEQGLAHLVPLLLPKDTGGGKKFNVLEFSYPYNVSLSSDTGSVTIEINKKFEPIAGYFEIIWKNTKTNVLFFPKNSYTINGLLWQCEAADCLCSDKCKVHTYTTSSMSYYNIVISIPSDLPKHTSSSIKADSVIGYILAANIE